MICTACRATRDLEDLIVFWPINRPEARRFVCRPTCPNGRPAGPCFYQVVGPTNVHTIALAAPGVTRLAPRESQPVVPFTPDWFRLMNEAGVRGAVAA
jgi:hypothetical protein